MFCSSWFWFTGALADCPDGSNLFITAPKKIEALSGSCLQIPCNFRLEPGQYFDSKSNIIGVWLKSDRKTWFSHSNNEGKYPMKITGNLREKNCTTSFSHLITSYTDTYYFRIESRPFKATAVCDPLQINVTGKRF